MPHGGKGDFAPTFRGHYEMSGALEVLCDAKSLRVPRKCTDPGYF